MTQVVACRLPTTSVAVLDKAANQLGLSRSDLARWALAALVESCQNTQTKEVSNG
jgi:hypothetical protein